MSKRLVIVFYIYSHPIKQWTEDRKAIHRLFKQTKFPGIAGIPHCFSQVLVNEGRPLNEPVRRPTLLNLMHARSYKKCSGEFSPDPKQYAGSA